mgnify:CR=1 FL=1
MRKSIRPLIAMTAALALTVTAGMSALAQADNTDKHFSVIEAASNEDSLTIPEIAKKCGTSVVAIETETKVVYNTYDNNYYNPFGGMFGYGYGYGYGNRGGRGGTQEYTQTAAGSGVIISEDGYVLTNNHVISGADKITVYVNPGDGSEEQSYEATLVGSSESNDIAVLKIDATGLNAAAFGDSDQIEVGELAVAIGNPMGQVHGSVTAGIISAVEQELTIDDVTINAIQTDAAINPGNSGGALFDSYGNVIGIVYAKSSSVSIEGIGYAIPVNNIKDLVAQMINDPDSVKDQTKGSQIMLGITIRDITEDMSKQYSMPVGVYITEVMASDDSVAALGNHISDWVELYNSSQSAVDLSGYGLSDRITRARKWQFPSGTVIQPGEYKIVLLDGKSDQTTTSELHASFKLLRVGGEVICLSDPSGKILDKITESFLPFVESVPELKDAPFSTYTLKNKAYQVGFLDPYIKESTLQAFEDDPDLYKDDFSDLYHNILDFEIGNCIEQKEIVHSTMHAQEDDDDEEYFELNHASPDGIEEYGSEIEAHRIAMEDDEDDLDMLEGCAA